MFRRNRLFPVSFIVIGILIGGGLALWQTVFGPKGPSSRTVLLTETFTLKELPPATRQTRIWFPCPPSTAVQKVEMISVDSPVPYHRGVEREFGNRALEFTAGNDAALPLTIRISYRMTRFEQNGLAGDEGAHASDGPFGASRPDRALYLTPRGLMVINDKIHAISREQTAGIQSPLRKARALYDYVFGHMRYDKSGSGWGRGDSVYACDIAKGNCTDFHALFITLAWAADIPARFHMGVPLGPEAAGTLGTKYHCWAEFYAEPYGWIPVDISEAWKAPEKQEYFFGTLDPNRFLVSIGRNLRLSATHRGPRLNFFNTPYVEINGGTPLAKFEFSRNYKNL